MQTCLDGGPDWGECLCGAGGGSGGGGQPSGGASSGGAVSDEPPEMEGMTAAHNAVRARVADASSPLPPLEWSAELAGAAQDWADQLAARDCPMQHSSNGYGENILHGWGTSLTVTEVVENWATEIECFTNGPYETCSCTCGHYSQLVWRRTQLVGCARAACPDGSSIWVCDYDPPGNFLGETPY